MAAKPTVTLVFAGDEKKLTQAMDRVGNSSKKMRDEVDHSARGMGQSTQQGASTATSALGGFGSKLLDVGKIAAGFVAAKVVGDGLSALKNLASSSVTAFSDLGESMNAVNKIFGSSQGVILKWGETNANSFGLSQRAFNQLAVPLGAGLKNAGLSLDLVTKHTIGLTERAADMASVFNTDVSEALEAIQAGLRGEADPLEKFGVGLSAAKVDAEALAMTGKKVTSELTDQEKMLARVNLIMRQTADTAGDFQGTSDGLANSQRILAARTEELQAKIGEKLAPVMAKLTEAKLQLVSAATDKLLPALDKVGAFMEDKVAPGAAKVQAGVNALLPGVKDLGGWLGDKLLPTVKSITSQGLAGLESAIDNVRGAIKDNRPELEQLLSGFKAFAGFMVGEVLPIVGPVLKFAFESLGRQITVTVATVGFLVKAFKWVTDTILDFVGMIINSTAKAFGWVPGIGDDLKRAAEEFNQFREKVNTALNGIKDRTVNINFQQSSSGVATRIALPALQRMHTGGVVPGAPGQEVLRILQGGERVVANGQSAPGRGGGGEWRVTGTGPLVEVLQAMLTDGDLVLVGR